MIPAQNLVAWGNVVPWADQRQVEQDLIISRALVEIFSDAMLRDELRFRGGTALNKLHFPASLRYSEDIDLVRTSAGPIGPILDQLRVVLEPWLGRAQFDQSPVAPKFRFRVDAEDGSGVPIRLKLEINTREIEAFDVPEALPLRVANPWFSGAASISTYSREEMLATKLRALLQRDKGRDLAPERLLRALLLQVLYWVRSERMLCEQLDYNLLFRWFVGLSADEPVWEASTFSKNRERLLAGDIAYSLFLEVYERARSAGLTSDEHFSVDGTLVDAWASHKSFRAKDGGDNDNPQGPQGETQGATSTASGARTTRTPRPQTRRRGCIARARGCATPAICGSSIATAWWPMRA